ncbi:hypothetical protein [Corallococcus macrosporus]|uniref:Uncharacterized protein n=1 Tax=Myxococcus fulvus (strain ATCC BAA-855 / HW-1) TaxID=483219 RepID=F8CEG8_MYXFH|nr:hypothetical protein [Corallococcus macrosporus]AEI64838.1 hypothetical protein LILAB_14665 [Corallococcus macrosporus]
MSRVFDVSAVSDTLRLSRKGTGEAVFHVINASDAPVRARLAVIPEAGARREWLFIDGDTERDIPSAGAQRVVVRLRVPAGTPAGHFAFHLRVEDCDRPDARFALGPVVTAEVVAAPAAAKARSMNRAVIAVGTFILLGTVASLLAADKARHPGPGAPCPDGHCGRGLTCATQVDGGVCLASRGQPCTRSDQCITGHCEPGVGCTVPLGKDCAAAQECPGALTCVDVLGSPTCLLAPEEACENDRDCASFFCNAERKCSRDDGRCDSNAGCPPPSQCGATKLCQLPDGQPCIRHEACLSGYCDETCQVSPESFQCQSPCPAYTACVSGQCIPVDGKLLNQNVLLTAPRTLKGIQELRIQQGTRP